MSQPVRAPAGFAPLEPHTLSGLLAIDRDRARAAPLLAALRTGERDWQDLTRTERRWLDGAPLLDFLLERSADLRFRDPAGMIELAQVARTVAMRLNPRRYGARVTADLRALAWAELANAHRVADDLDAAAAGLSAAVAWARRGTGDLRLAARLGHLTASLFNDQRRFSEAVQVLDLVCAAYDKVGEPAQAARALLTKGLAAGYDNKPEEAVQVLAQALYRFQFQGTKEEERMAVHALSWHLVDAGRFRAARRLLETTTRLHRRDRDFLNRLRLFWLQGRIAFGLDEFGRAEAAFHVARLGFKRVEKHGDAALVSLDLALLFARQGKRLQTLRLVEEMVTTFRRLGIAREAIASLLLLRRTCEQEAASRDALCGQIRTISVLVGELKDRPARGR